jgi:peptidyl-prolyl cis-trans isomerase B (cyclophilin B)
MSKRFLPVLLLLATAALAACGDDDAGDDTAKDSSSGSSTSPTSSSTSADASSGSGSSGTPQGSADPADVTCDYPVDSQSPVAKEVDPPPSAPTVGGDVPVTFHTNLGDFTATLDATKAPCTVNSFVSLATQGYNDDSP